MQCTCVNSACVSVCSMCEQCMCECARTCACSTCACACSACVSACNVCVHVCSVCVSVCRVCVHVCVCTLEHMWRSEDNLQEFILSFHYVDSRYRTWVIRLGTRTLAHSVILTASHFNCCLIFFKDLFIFMCLRVLLTCVYVHCAHAYCQEGQECRF